MKDAEVWVDEDGTVEGWVITRPEYIKKYQPEADQRIYFSALVSKKPVFVGTFNGVLEGNFGYSNLYKRNVVEVIQAPMGNTIFINTFIYDTSCSCRCDHMICFNNSLAISCIYINSCITACDTLLERLDNFLAVGECLNGHSDDLFFTCAAVILTDDELL